MNRWFIGVKYRGSTEDTFSTEGFKPLPMPEGHYWADPFLATDGDKTYLFFEDYDYNKGVIAVGELRGLNLFDVHTIIDEPFHISFPSVIKLADAWYMAPERVVSGELWIYKATTFPYEWEPWAKVANGRYDDPILRQGEGHYELWCNEDGDKLRVFHAPSLFGPWSLRVTEDRRYARSAGNFMGNIRPVQDSLPIYGRALRFMDGTKEVGAIEPDWYPGLTGTHTFNVSGKYVVIDGRVAL